MFNTLFQGIFSSTTITVQTFLLCIAVSIAIGVYLSLVYAFRSRCTKSFVVTLALLPSVVAVVIMMVNGNVGAGVAVAGAFSLVRFRSVPGSAKEIGTIFLAMGAGLVAGMGYLGYAVLFAVVLGAVMLLLNVSRFGEKQAPDAEKILHITIPEDLNYGDVFDDLLGKYTTRWELTSVKTTNMGSLFKLSYRVVLADVSQEKAFIDALRCRNGNLEISIVQKEVTAYEL